MRRINLLPPEIAEKRRARRQTAGLVVGLLAFVGLLIALFIFRQIDLQNQEDRLEAARANVRTLEAQRAELDEFARLEATVKLKEQTLSQAMVGDVGWSTLLIELSMTIPGDSWITSFAGSAGSVPTPGAVGAAPKLGSVTFAAVTFEFPGVAKWITRLQEMKSLQNIWVPSATKAAIGDREVVNFASTADLSQQAASNRYQTVTTTTAGGGQ